MPRSPRPLPPRAPRRVPRRPLLALLTPGLLGALLLGGDPPRVRAADLPYPPGTSTQVVEGLDTTLVLPEGLSAETPASLVLILHGLGGTATGMAGTFAPWAQDGYVVCAPKSQGQGWEPDDLQRTLRIAAHLKSVLPIDPKKVHVVGFSNGGWNLAPLAFDDALRPCSATWIAAGFQGGAVPKWAKEGLGAIALAGSEDGNLGAARATVPALRDKVRSVEVRVQEGLGHAFPRELAPYLQWWMGVMEGRFTPGDEKSFEWTEDLDAAIASLAGAKKGGVMAYLFAAADAGKPAARALQREAFFDPEVRFLGAQVKAVKIDAAAHPEVVTRLGVKDTPAVVVLDRQGKVEKVMQGEVKARALAKALRGIAPQRTMPKD